MLDAALIDETKKAIQKARSFTILTHLNPDVDTLATGLGVYALLKQNTSKPVEIVNGSQALPFRIDFLSGFDRIKQKSDFSDSFVITCDSASIDRLGVGGLKGKEILNIDHHQSNTRFGTINAVEPSFASASQVAYTLFKPIFAITPQAAEAFYAALVSDTQGFSTSQVDAEVFEVAKELIDAGADPAKVAHHLHRRRSLASVRILHRALGTLKLYRNATVAMMHITKEALQETGAQMYDTEGAVEYARALSTVEVGVLMIESDEGIKVSLRSKGYDVGGVAQYFGGGGHKHAAGFVYKNGTIECVKDKILDHLAQYLHKEGSDA